MCRDVGAELKLGATTADVARSFSCAAALALICLTGVAAQQDPSIAIRAGRLFDAKTGTMLANQVVLIRGERIADVGANVAVPPGARVTDQSSSTVLPGMI